MINENIAEVGKLAQIIEGLGIVGILTLIAMIFIYLHVKEVRLMQETLKDVKIKIEDLIEHQKELNHKLFDLLIDKNRRDKH